MNLERLQHLTAIIADGERIQEEITELEQALTRIKSGISVGLAIGFEYEPILTNHEGLTDMAIKVIEGEIAALKAEFENLEVPNGA